MKRVSKTKKRIVKSKRAKKQNVGKRALSLILAVVVVGAIAYFVKHTKPVSTMNPSAIPHISQKVKA